MPAHILLCIDTSRHYGRAAVLGANAYALRHADWIFDAQFQRANIVRSLQSNEHYDGMLCQILPDEALPLVAGRRMPYVSVEAGQGGQMATVIPDNAAIGRMAAEYFLRRGYERIGYCGPEDVAFSDERRAAMRQAVVTAGREFCEVSLRITGAGLKQLSYPMGVLAAVLQIGANLAGKCRMAGVMVPEQLSILTVDNDEVAAEITRPPLSTIDQHPEEIGYRAAELLHALMEKGTRPATELRVQPLGIVERQSSAATAVADEDVATVLRYISRHALEGAQAGDVFGAIPVARRTVEIRFRKLLGRTVQEEITRVRLDRARFLLARTHLSIAAISQQCGFSCQSDLSKTFARVYGTSPLKFRQTHRHGGAEASVSALRPRLQ